MSGHGMIVMYGMPPDQGSPRFKPVKPMEPGKEGIGPVTHPMPGVQAMPPITHNPFTGEPVNVLEMLAQNALLIDEKARLEKHVVELKAVCDSRLSEITQLKHQATIDAGTIHVLETKVKGLEFQDEQRKAKGKKK